MFKKATHTTIITFFITASIINASEVLQKKLAFLQGLHQRLGARSLIPTAPLPAIQQILDYLPHNRMVHIENCAKPMFSVKISDMSDTNDGQAPCVWQGILAGFLGPIFTSRPNCTLRQLPVIPLRLSIYGATNDHYYGTIDVTSEEISNLTQIKFNHGLASITLAFEDGHTEIKCVSNCKW